MKDSCCINCEFFACPNRKPIRLDSGDAEEDGVEGDDQHQKESAGGGAFKAEEMVFEGIVAAGSETIAAQSAGNIGAAIFDIGHIQRIIAAGGVTNPAIGAGGVVDSNSKGR